MFIAVHEILDGENPDVDDDRTILVYVNTAHIEQIYNNNEYETVILFTNGDSIIVKETMAEMITLLAVRMRTTGV